MRTNYVPEWEVMKKVKLKQLGKKKSKAGLHTGMRQALSA